MSKLKNFKKIGVMAKPKSEQLSSTIESLISFLLGQKRSVVVNATTEQLINSNQDITLVENFNSSNCDLLIVVGGDGSLLNAARQVVDCDLPVLGINRGSFGFLTDINPKMIDEKVGAVLAGEYEIEKRFLLDVSIGQDGVNKGKAYALNDCVLNAGDIARMIEFEVYIDDKFVYSQRSDGLITATPTGSTAYALSGGGPILQPWLDAVVLVPMLPHTFSARPIVINSSSVIKIKVPTSNEIYPTVACDGQVHFSLTPGDEVIIQRKAKELLLVHPTGYDYYTILRNKLGWGSKLSNLDAQ